MFRRCWKWYEDHLHKAPLRTKVVMSVCISAAADITAQAIGSARKKKNVTEQALNSTSAIDTSSSMIVKRSSPDAPAVEIDMRRQFAIWCYAGIYQGPFGHWWYGFLDRQFQILGKWTIPAKVLADQLVDAPIANSMYLSIIPTIEGRGGWDWSVRKMRLDFIPVYVIDLAFWPLCQAINFGAVPLRHQLLFANVCVFAWQTFMSLVCHDDQALRRLDFLNPFGTVAEDIAYLKACEEHRCVHNH
eukprot:m.117657 g.117657  ORF g.117657 m.117657 type:complete len:245 (+) comp17187_c0_seq2:320-1054(+)